MPTAEQEARARLSPEQVAVLAADPAVSARFEEFMAEALAKPRSRFWGACSWGWELVPSRMVDHAVYTVGLERRRAEIAAEAMAKAA